jgi:hypothetical protein
MIVLCLLLQAATELPQEKRDMFGLFPADAYTAEGVEVYSQYFTVPDTSRPDLFRVKGNLAEWAARHDVTDPAFWEAIAEKNLLGKGCARFPLEIAVTRGNASLVKTLVELGADDKISVNFNVFSHTTEEDATGKTTKIFDSRLDASLLDLAREKAKQTELSLLGEEGPKQYGEIIAILSR